MRSRRSRQTVRSLAAYSTGKASFSCWIALTRPEIARELYVSIHTVNTHIRNIYSKLDARDRSSALSRARELRVLSGGRS